VIRRVFEDGAYADLALHVEARGLDARERGLATRLAYGAVQRKATLDHVISQLAGRPVERLEPGVLAALRLGVFQLAYLDRIPAHAAVGQSVELAKGASKRGAGLVNAVLRRAAREARGIVEALPEATPEQAALRHSHPRWIAELCGRPSAPTPPAR
jgi:16S rRNA (cytosine967-C5)-methyltransferase